PTGERDARAPGASMSRSIVSPLCARRRRVRARRRIAGVTAMTISAASSAIPPSSQGLVSTCSTGGEPVLVPCELPPCCPASEELVAAGEGEREEEQQRGHHRQDLR